ncbi:MAG: SDR family oxidoreductase [Haloarculaceae archaeon]
MDLDPAVDVVLLTGATSGIGRDAARRLADAGATVIATGRDRERGRRLATETNAAAPGHVSFVRADFADFDAIRGVAEHVLAEYDRLDVLVNNAACSRDERHETAAGIEETLAVNHLAPYLLTRELIDRLRESGPARVVTTASGVHERATLDFDDLQFERGYDALSAYARSKLANVAFTLELAERLSGTDVTANCLHPGFVPGSGIYRDAAWFVRLFTRVAHRLGRGTSVADAGAALARLAGSPAVADVTGTYFDRTEPAEPSAEARDHETRERLWRVSADLVGVDPDWP